MRGLLRVAPLALVLAPAPVLGDAAAPLRRLALVVGSNRGAADRVPLRYAVADADRFADLVTRMGGVAPHDRIVLRDPTRRNLLDALAATGVQAGSARAATQRVEVIVYFSGHADEQGLMLGREVLPYKDLRAAIQGIGADVGITILDACASGAITRLKGGQARPAFLSDVASEVQGYAYLTSSSEDEAAQESERLRGSFFTHALLTGLRGAADVSGDGKITLNEAYQFAFNETLVQTTTTQAGAQHPAYDIKMAGTGDVVMTDVRENSASLILGEQYDGRFLVLSGRRHLVAELYKPAGRRVELGLEPGEYEVYFAEDRHLLKSTLSLREGQRQELTRADLKQAERLPTRLRGSERVADQRLPRFGVRYTSRSGDGILSSGGRLELVYRPSERIAIRPRWSPGWSEINVDSVFGVNVAFQFRPGRNWRPYLSAGLEWENRHLPPPIDLFRADGTGTSVPAPPESGRDRTFFTASFGMERRLSSRWSFVAEVSSRSPEREESWSFNGQNWQSESSGDYLDFGIGLSWNFGARAEPKARTTTAP